MKTARWLLPSVSHWLWLLLLVMLLVPAWRTAMVASDGDACMHWRVGEWMLQNRQIVRTDTFSHTKFGEPVISKEWLAEIIFALAGRAAGLYGLAVVAALVIATSFALLHRQLVRAGNDLLAATGITVLAVWAANTHWLARPHVFSFLLMWLWNDALRSAGVPPVLSATDERHGRDGRAALLLLPVLTVLWVNLHGAFLAGFFVLGAYWLGAVIERDWTRVRRLTVIGALCAVASLANPSGYKLHLHNLAFLQSKFLTGWLAEYSSTNFHSPGSFGFLAWLALIFLTLALRRPKVSAGDGVLLVMWMYFALYAGRNIPLLVILTAPILAPAWTGLWRDRLQQINEACRGWPVVAVAAVAFVVFAPHQTEMPAERWPVRAVEFVRQSNLTGHMFNQYVWGGYLMWYLPEHRTFVDGRTDFFGEGVIREFSDTTALRPGWEKPLEKYDVRWTLMPSDHRLNLALAARGGWSCVYSDEVAMVWRRAE
jgi:hypothetical protein